MRDRTADLLRARQALSQLSYSPIISVVSNHKACQVNQFLHAVHCVARLNRATTKRGTKLVGLGRFELPTSPLSGVRSNQLSYRPAVQNLCSRLLSHQPF